MGPEKLKWFVWKVMRWFELWIFWIISADSRQMWVIWAQSTWNFPAKLKATRKVLKYWRKKSKRNSNKFQVVEKTLQVLNCFVLFTNSSSKSEEDLQDAQKS